MGFFPGNHIILIQKNTGLCKCPYVNHFILLKVIKTILAHYFYGNEMAALLTFLLSPIFVTFLMWKVGELWHRVHPKSFALVTGGRA